MGEPINLFGKLQGEAEELLGALPICNIDRRNGDDDAPSFGFPSRMIEDALRRLYTKTRLDMFLRMTHFIAAAELAELSVCDLLFGAAPRADCFRAAFSDARTTRLYVENDAAVASYKGGVSFITPFKSMPKTACALNIACLFLGPDDLNERLRDISASSDDNDRLFAIAKSWANAFESYIREREGSRQEARAFREITDFLNKSFPDGRFTFRDVTSEHVLQFWLDNAEREELDVTLYSTAHSNFSDFAAAYASYEARLAAHNAASTSASFEEGGAQDEMLLERGRPIETSSYEDWIGLNEETQGIKFLLGNEQKCVEPIADLTPEAEMLLLSAVRATVFGEVEKKLVEAKRRKNTPDKIAAILRDGPSLTYDEMLTAYYKIASGFENAIFASAYVLAANRREEGFLLLIATVPELQDEERMWDAIREYGLSKEDLLESGLTILTDSLYKDFFNSAELPAPFADALAKAEACWKANNRAGFRRDQLYLEEITDRHEMAANRLPKANRHLVSRLRKVTKVLKAAQKESGGFGKDKTVFERMFSKMHVSSVSEGV